MAVKERSTFPSNTDKIPQEVIMLGDERVLELFMIMILPQLSSHR